VLISEVLKLSKGKWKLGYRNRLALLSIEKYNNIKDKTYAEICEQSKDTSYISCYTLSNEVHCFGKRWERDFLNPFKKDIFTLSSTNDHFNDEDGEFYIIGMDGLKAIIESYHKKIADYYKSIINPDPKDVQIGWHTTPEQHIRSQLSEWDNEFCKPYDLDLNSDEIVSSWKFEYAIFELVRIYKTVDETKHLICITGW
jgi:hypothetical protein